MTERIPYVDAPVPGRHIEQPFLTDRPGADGKPLVIVIEAPTIADAWRIVRARYPQDYARWTPLVATVEVPDRKGAAG